MQSLNEQINRMIELFGAEHGVIKPLMEQTENEKVLEKTINFDSGKWSAAAGNIKGLLDPQMAEIENFLRDNGASSKLVTIVLEASESYVPNYDTEVTPKKPLAPKELSKRRYDTIETYMSDKLAQWQQAGLIPTNPTPKIEKLEPKTGGPKWSPPAGTTTEQLKQLVNSKQYTDHQYLRMFIKVTTTEDPKIPKIIEAFTSLETNREAIAKTNGNAPFFYSYSMAAAAVMNVDYKTLPSQLLTMNKYFRNRKPISIPGTNIIIPDVTITIKPDSDNEVDVVVSDKTINGLGNGQAWQARISNTYQLIIPFKPGTPQYIGSWLFAFFYLTGPSQLNDWDRISNKPTDVEFFDANKITRDNVEGLISVAGQADYFKQGGVFIKGLVEEEWIPQFMIDRKKTFAECYRAAVTNYYNQNPKEEEEAETGE